MGTTPLESRILAPRSGLTFAVAVILGFVLLVILAMSARIHRAQIESTALSYTAIKDSAFFPLPSQIDPRTPLLEWKGLQYYPANASPAAEDDDMMVKAGSAGDADFVIYRKARKDSAVEGDEETIFVKAGPGEFLALRPRR